MQAVCRYLRYFVWTEMHMNLLIAWVKISCKLDQKIGLCCIAAENDGLVFPSPQLLPNDVWNLLQLANIELLMLMNTNILSHADRWCVLCYWLFISCACDFKNDWLKIFFLSNVLSLIYLSKGFILYCVTSDTLCRCEGLLRG